MTYGDSGNVRQLVEGDVLAAGTESLKFGVGEKTWFLILRSLNISMMQVKHPQVIDTFLLVVGTSEMSDFISSNT